MCLWIFKFLLIYLINLLIAMASRSNIVPRRKMGEDHPNFKVELCRKFNIFGSCPYGSRCQFAHGVTELRQEKKHRNRKTVLCKSFQEGCCSYGVRCSFIHISSPTHHILEDEIFKSRDRGGSSRRLAIFQKICTHI